MRNVFENMRSRTSLLRLHVRILLLFWPNLRMLHFIRQRKP